MKHIPISDISQNLESMKNKIHNQVIKRIYSKFIFNFNLLSDFTQNKSLNYNTNIQSQREKNIFDYFHKFKFIILDIKNLRNNFPSSSINESHSTTQDSSTDQQIADVIICVEGECHIIEGIEIQLFKKIIEKLKSHQISVLNVSCNIIKAIHSAEEYLAGQEIKNFCSKFESEIKNNKFVEITIRAIVGFMIRRYFYPTNYFQDSSFFTFRQTNETNDYKIKAKLADFFYSTKNDGKKFPFIFIEIKKYEDNKNDTIFEDFQQSDFISLRCIYSNNKAHFFLAMHIDTFYLFVVKKLTKSNITSEIEHEIHFCQNFSHRCITKFYGFLKNDEKIIGFVYEFMSNDSLERFLNSNKEQMTEMNKLMTICRIFQGIDYLHSNSLIHRDLKPLNILIDHDGLPYISDNETIRNEDSEEKTNDIGAPLYASPEQERGDIVSFPSDIYSFGLILYFLYNNNEDNGIYNINAFIQSNRMNDKVKLLSKARPNIQYLFEQCVKLSPEKRATNKTIKNIILEEFSSFYYFDKFLLYPNKINENLDYIHFLYECFMVQPFDEVKIKVLVRNFHLFRIIFFLIMIDQDPTFSFNTNDTIYLSSLFRKEDFLKIKKYYEILAMKNNPDALYHLGFFYLNGFGVELDPFKAKEYFELSAKQNHPAALYNLGQCYNYGLAVKQDKFKARYYYELSAQLNNPDSINSLGGLYMDGQSIKKDNSKAKEYFELGAKQNDSFAIFNLGLLYYLGDGVKQDYLKAKEFFELSAKQNNPNALCYLGVLYFEGYGVNQDINLAKKYLEQSSYLGNSDASNYLGCLYLDGLGVQQDLTLAREYFELSAKYNNANSFHNLGVLYQRGLGVNQDYLIAKEYYELSAKQNNPHSINNLGWLYFNGVGVKQDYSLAMKYYESATQQNHPAALYNLGLCYEIGKSVQQNYLKAIEYYELAGKQNYAKALNNLGKLYEKGFGVKQDYLMAKKYYELAAKQNYSIALFNLGNLYEEGYGVEQSYPKAKEYYELSAKQNNSEALFNLGYFYNYGKAVKRDYLKAKEYYELAAKQNNSDALYYLGVLYDGGYGVEQNYLKAKEYYELAEKQNNSSALLSLGFLYEEGKGVKQDYLKAKEYYEKSSNLNDSDGLVFLGYLYLEGNGVTKDFSKSMKYFEKAAKQNNSDAYLCLGEMYEKGYDVKIDYLKAKHYYTIASNLDNDEAFTYLGKLYEKGHGVEQSYEKAKEYHEIAAGGNCGFSIYKLGRFYEKGLAVKQDYLKAKEYYELAARPNNSIPLFRLGKLYEKGRGVKQDYLKARDYYELSAKSNNTYAHFYLGCFYSNEEIIDIDLTKSIYYLIKCSEIHNEKVVFETEDCHSFERRFNKYCYRSSNDLGLIYLTFFKDIDKATKYIKEAAFAEYPFAQNNFGLLNELYFNKIYDAQHMYERSSEHHFALAEYNLGHMFEKDNKIEESINFYKKASEDEDVKLIFQNHKHYDKKLEISKTFIICFTNLKLTEYYLSLENYEESRKYFIKAFNKLLSNETYQFLFKFDSNENDNLFSYLKSFLLGFPLFNIANQPYLNLNYSTNINRKESTIKNKLAKNKCEIIESCLINENNKREEKEFENPGKLFDFAISNKKIKDIFITEIKEIIQSMKTMLYTPPYNILFGRMSLKRQLPKKKKKIYSFQKEINELFYEGFSL
ncbi:hypothetical protein M9Y10_010874 [Tritrichomonas musculus]|uniref:Protein kinase domain-containing protein n=1 Tax=Tritrichomonas musculus TaxID=1915356 RepID=A0ABR2ILW2_9EUKA